MSVTFELSQQRTRSSDHFERVAMFNRDKKDLLHQFVTVDERWIYHNTQRPKNSRNSKLLQVNRRRTRPCQFCRQTRWWPQFLGRVWYHTHGLNRKKQKAKLLDHFDTDLKKRLHLAMKKVLYHQTGIQLCNLNSKTPWIAFQLDFSSTIFPR